LARSDLGVLGHTVTRKLSCLCTAFFVRRFIKNK
jgi:hypothetical protein